MIIFEQVFVVCLCVVEYIGLLPKSQLDYIIFATAKAYKSLVSSS